MGNFRELSGPFKSIGGLRCSVAAALAAKGIIQSPITPCNRRDHSVCQASANSLPKISGSRWCGLSAVKGAVGLHSAGEVWYLRLPCLYLFLVAVKQCQCTRLRRRIRLGNDPLHVLRDSLRSVSLQLALSGLDAGLIRQISCSLKDQLAAHTGSRRSAISGCSVFSSLLIQSRVRNASLSTAGSSIYLIPHVT